jgi:hypothetical protein
MARIHATTERVIKSTHLTRTFRASAGGKSDVVVGLGFAFILSKISYLVKPLACVCVKTKKVAVMVFLF